MTWSSQLLSLKHLYLPAAGVVVSVSKGQRLSGAPLPVLQRLRILVISQMHPAATGRKHDAFVGKIKDAHKNRSSQQEHQHLKDNHEQGQSKCKTGNTFQGPRRAIAVHRMMVIHRYRFKGENSCYKQEDGSAHFLL